VLKLARTIADLAEAADIGSAHLGEAIQSAERDGISPGLVLSEAH